MHQCALKTKLPVLKVNQVIVNLLNVHVGPEKVIVAVDGGVDSGEESVELLQQVELPLCLLQLGVLVDSEAKESLSSRAGLVSPP